MAGLNAYEDEIVFKMHKNGFFEFGPLRYVEGSVYKLFAFVHDRSTFTLGLDHMLTSIRGDKWALFFCLPGKSLEDGLKLIHTDNDVHTMLELGCRSGSVDLFVAHKPQRLSEYYLKNMDLEGQHGELIGWVEEDASLRCSSTSAPFRTRYNRERSVNLKRKVVGDADPEFGKNKKVVKRSVDKGK